MPDIYCPDTISVASSLLLSQSACALNRRLAAKGYNKLLSNVGRSYIDFMYYLNQLHTHLSTTGMFDFLPADIKIQKV